MSSPTKGFKKILTLGLLSVGLTATSSRGLAQSLPTSPLSMEGFGKNQGGEASDQDLKGKTKAGVKAFANESDAGVTSASGNSSAKSFHIKQKNAYQWDENIGKFAGQYLQSSADGVESARNWYYSFRLERVLSPMWGAFVGQMEESDVFAGFERRHNSDIGAKYIAKNDPEFNWFFEGGFRYTTEAPVAGTTNYYTSARLYSQIEKRMARSITGTYWIEFLPQISRGENYFLNQEAAINCAFSDIFSIKMAYLIKYQHRPNEASIDRSDTLFTTSLVATY